MQKRTVVMGAGLLAVVLLAGCQSVENQIGKKLAEGMVGQAIGGDVKIDEKGGNVTIKTKDGEAVFGSGDTRPASVSADMPSLPNAKGFSWMGTAEGGSFIFTVDSSDVKGECTKEEALITQANWKVHKDSFVMEAEDFKTNTFYKDGRILSVNCSKDGEKVQIMLSSGKDTSARAEEDQTETTATETTEVKDASDTGSTDSTTAEDTATSSEVAPE